MPICGTLPSNTDRKMSAIGFITHMDTASEASGKDVKARLVRNFDGGDIVLNESLKVIMSPRDFPFMKDYVGHDWVVTDGTALSWRGLITPNIFIGGHNYHGRFEFISVQVMENATEVALKILELAAKP